MFIKITNGIDTYVVPNGAMPVFKNQGFHKVDEVQAEEQHIDNTEVDEVVDDQFAELLEKPISKWTKNEVREFAGAKGIDIRETRSVNDAKEIIKQYLNR